MGNQPYPGILRYLRKTYLKTLPVDSFARDAPWNINIPCASFLEDLSVRGEYRDIHMCLEWITRVAGSLHDPIYDDVFAILIHIRP
jgi:hypothetical protein